MRIGIGYDIHPLVRGRKLILGGVEIASPLGLAGHSDADVLLHAMMDAVLGAAGLSDIGHFFPNTDPRWKDVSSVILLEHVHDALVREGYVVGNIDATLIAEAPRVAAHVGAMKEKIARALDIMPTQVGIKATTNEQLGALGRGEGIAAMAVALLLDRNAVKL